MVHRSTYTYTRYFGDDSLDAIRAELQKLEEDWESRRPHIDAETAVVGDLRLTIVRNGIELLGDPVV